jgi:hypothetical protein
MITDRDIDILITEAQGFIADLLAEFEAARAGGRDYGEIQQYPRKGDQHDGGEEATIICGRFAP